MFQFARRSTRPVIGNRISAYEVLSELGSGGMGSVYLAQCVEDAVGLDAGVQVALKVIHPNLLSQPGFFKRFLREARIGQEVQHENVVRTHDCDATLVDGQQQNYLVMEYVEGQTLRDLLEELERVPEELCRHIGREVAKGLAAIHEAGVVHRDIKPENVLITEQHVVKVMDLGVARLQDEAMRLSQAGAFVGSLEYAAPEQFRSADGEPDGRADLHALGVVLYELATGQHPYRDEDASRVLRNILDEAPRKVGEVNPQLSPFFEEVVGTLIAKNPDERFADAAALAAVLDEGESGDWWKARAKALRIETKRPLRRIRIPRETALYGRDEDLARLHTLFDKAKAGGGQVLLVEGEAGIGKTRLVDEFVGRIRQEGEDVNFLFGSYPPGGAATAAGAFSEAYREQFGEEGSAPWLAQTPVLVPAFDALLRGEPLPKDVEALTKDSLGTVFVHATRSLAAERPTIVLIDDLHFAPEDARSLFMTLALAVPGHRILLVGTLRPGIDETWVSNVTRLEHVAHAALARLGPKDLVSLLEDSFRSQRLANELGTQIALKSDGNPFFAFEIIRGLREGQFITRQPDGTWASTQAIRDIQIPASVLDLVNARVADLTEEERDLLDVACCCGFEFDPGLIGDVLGLGRIPLLKRFGQIERAHRLVRSSGRNYVFDHHQVQEALYGSLHEQMREEYHAAIADALEARTAAPGQDPQDLDGALCVDLCEHFLKGARGERALPYLDAALDHLEQGHLGDHAIALSSAALDVEGLLEGEARVDVLLRKNAHLDRLGKRGAQEAVLAEAEALAEEAGDDEARGRVARELGRLLTHMSRFAEAEAASRRAIAIARARGDRMAEAVATGFLGNVFHYQSRLAEAEEHHQRSLSLCGEIGYRRGQATATANLANVFKEQGLFRQARACLEQSVAFFREVGDRLSEAHVEINLSSVLKEQGRLAQAREHNERALRLCREVGSRAGEAMATGNLGLVFVAEGRLAEARELSERHLALSAELGSRRGEAIALVNLGPTRHALGDPTQARRALERSVAICREIGARYPEGYGLLGLGRLADEAGDPAEAERRMEASLALRREIGHGDGVAATLVEIADLHRREGDESAARAEVDEALSLLRAQGGTAQVPLALAVRACLAGGATTDGEDALAAAGEPGDRSRVRWLLHQATGDRVHLDEAKRLLDEALSQVPEAYHEAMRTNVRVNREILEAWAAAQDPERDPQG